jgi:hypothetical protein
MERRKFMREFKLEASYRDIRCHSSADTVRQALIGNYREEHLFALAQAVELYEVYQAKVATCDEKIEGLLERLKQLGRAPAATVNRVLVDPNLRSLL